MFCCSGCEAVHGLLAEEGLLRFYELGGGARDAIGSAPRVPAFDWLPGYERRHAAGGDGAIVRLDLDVQGIRCAACVWLLRALWQKLQRGDESGSLQAIEVSPSLGRVTLTYREGSSRVRPFLELAARLGYPMAPPSRQVRRDTGLLVRLGICAAIAMNAMILAVSLYFGLDASVGGDDVSLRALFGWVLLALGTLSVAVGGPVFFRGALAGVRAGVVHMDLPISLGIATAYAGSVYGQLTGGATWFDTLAIFIAFMLGGRFLQQRTLARNRDQVLADDGAEHLRARCVRDGQVDLVPVRELVAGDRLVLAPGDLVPARGRLVGAGGTFSLDWINGESEPRSYAEGDEVPAGAFQAGRSAVHLQLTAGYDDSGLAALLSQEPIDREDTRGRVRFWERLNRGYALGVLMAALLGALIWLPIDATRALPVAVSVLVVTCPCAMGIAVPLAFHLALAALRRRGVFVRTRSLLDKVRVLRCVVFDKTGTVTFGGLRAQCVGALTERARTVLATMCSASNHPVSVAVLEAIGRARLLDGVEVVERPGQGLELCCDGAVWRLGSPAFALRRDADPADAGQRCLLSRNGQPVAGFRIDEDFRAGARAELEQLRRRGLEVRLMSGDRPERVAAAAERLGLPPGAAEGGMSPADKAAAIAAFDHDDTMMVGDGLNDAPAFQAAYCAGTPAIDRPVLPARADFCFRGAQAGAVAALCDVADRHARVVRTNLVMAVAYNVFALSLSFAGLMTPLWCAVLMPISSVLLLLHTSVRMGRRSIATAVEGRT